MRAAEFILYCVVVASIPTALLFRGVLRGFGILVIIMLLFVFLMRLLEVYKKNVSSNPVRVGKGLAIATIGVAVGLVYKDPVAALAAVVLLSVSPWLIKIIVERLS